MAAADRLPRLDEPRQSQSPSWPGPGLNSSYPASNTPAPQWASRQSASPADPGPRFSQSPSTGAFGQWQHGRSRRLGGPPPSSPLASRGKPLQATQWVGDQSVLIESMQRQVQSLQTRLQMVTAYTETGRQPEVHPMDDLMGMPYRAYGLQHQSQPHPWQSRGHFSSSATYWVPRTGTRGRQTPTQPRPNTVANVYHSYGGLQYTSGRNRSPQGMHTTPDQFARHSTPTWSPMLTRPHTSMDTTLDTWQLYSGKGAMRKSRESLPAASNPSLVAEVSATRLDGPLKEVYTEVDAVLLRIQHLFRDSETQDVAEAAAAVIQKTFRRWVARKRFEHAQWAIRAWHREEHAAARQRLLGWVARRKEQEQFISLVRVCQDRDLVRLAFRGWLVNIEDIQQLIRDQEARAAVLYAQIRQLRAKEQLKHWLAIALGDRSRKACKRRYQDRCNAARLRLTKMAQDMGWTGNITDDMIKRELENDAVNVMTIKIRIRQYHRVMAGWAKFARVRRIAKGKHLESDRKYNKFLINKCFNHWQELVYNKMESWRSKGWDFSRRKLWAIARREGRARTKRWALRQWRRRVRVHGRLQVFSKAMISRTQEKVFQAFRDQVAVQLSIKKAVTDRWALYSRDKFAYPFRCWVKYTVRERLLKEQRMKAAGGMLYRYRRRLMLRCFSALKMNVQLNRVVLDLTSMETAGDGGGLPSGSSPEFARPPLSAATTSKSLPASGPMPRTPSLKQEDSTEAMDAELEALISSSVGRPSNRTGSARMVRQRSRRISRSVIFQPEANLGSNSSAPFAFQAAEEKERIISSIERNLEAVLARPLDNAEMEAHRLTIFLEEMEARLSDARRTDGPRIGSPLRLEVPQSPAADPMDLNASIGSSEGGRLLKPPSRAGSRPQTSASVDSEGRSLSSPHRRSARGKLTGSKSVKSKPSRGRSMSRHQRAFFQALEPQEGTPDSQSEEASLDL